MDVGHIKGLLEHIGAEAGHASRVLDEDNTTFALAALTRIIKLASDARCAIAKGTPLEGYYDQKAGFNR